MRHENVLYLNVKPYVKTLSVNEMIQRYLKSPLASNILNVKEFTSVISERMGSVKKQMNVHLNLHESNYISLNTPFDNASSREDVEYKNSGDKLFNYIKMFLKTKVHSKRGTKAHSFHHDSQTRRRRRYRRDNHLVSSVSLSTHQTRKHGNNNRKRLQYLKTRKNGKFMRI
jgi:hypothetical protein